MATDILVRKMHHAFAPIDDSNLELMEHFKIGSIYRATFTRPRNVQFFRKFWALLDLAYNSWEPEKVFHKGQEVHKNKEVFRKNIIILAGHGEPFFNIKCEVRYEAKSISFAKMDEETFEQLYSSVIDVVLQKVLLNYTEEDLRETVDKVLGFA